MDAFALIAERRIEEAMEQGLFDDLPGKGKPLLLDESPFENPANRLANIVLKNAKILPPQAALRKEVHELKKKLGRVPDPAARAETVREINARILKINTMRKDHVPTAEPEILLASGHGRKVENVR